MTAHSQAAGALGGLGPSVREQDLLIAATGSASEAAAAWIRWRAGGAIEEALLVEQELLPAVLANLPNGAASSPDVATLRGLYRWSWYRNQRLAQTAAAAVAALGERGVESLAFKGVALAWSAYDLPAARLTQDVDLLVRPSDFRAATTALTDGGWPPKDTRRLRPWNHASTHLGAEGFEIDLHRWAFAHPFGGHDRDVWKRSTAVTIAGANLRRLSDEHELVLSLLHALRPYERSRLRCYLDVGRLASSPLFEWDHVLAVCPPEVALRVGPGLRYAAALLGLTLPAAVRRMDSARAPVAGRALWRYDRHCGGGRLRRSLSSRLRPVFKISSVRRW